MKVLLNGIRKKVTLCHINGVPKKVVFMMAITDEQEKILDETEQLTLEEDDITIHRDDVYCYGDIDINNQEDINYITKFNLIDNYESSNMIHSNFNYDKDYVEFDKVPKMYGTSDIVKWFKYNHLLLGRPTKIIIYKTNIYNNYGKRS